MKNQAKAIFDGKDGAKHPDEYYRHCGDCGRFVKRELWIRKDNRNGYTQAECKACLSEYDSPYAY